MKLNIEGITHPESLQSPPGGGNCLNWVLSHILNSRNGVFPWIGLEPFWGEEHSGRYGRGSPPLTDPAEAVPFQELERLYGESQQWLFSRLPELNKQQLQAALPNPGPVLGTTVREGLVTVAFHEAYHVGKTALLRRVLGKKEAIP